MKKRYLPSTCLVLAGLAALTLTGCPSSSQQTTSDTSIGLNSTVDRSAGAFAQTDPWLLTTSDPTVNRGNHGVFLGNGSLGATFGPNGGASKESVSYVAGVYDAEERLKALPNWHDLGLPAPKPGEKYEQTLDMRRGILTTRQGDATVTAFVSAARPYLAVLQGSGGGTVSLPAVSQGEKEVQIHLRDNKPDGKPWTRFVAITRAGEPAPALPLAQLDYAEELRAHEAAWAKRWKEADIQIEGDPEAQQLVHKLMFDLLQSARTGGNDSIPPETLAGEFYKGHIFWDAEVWMFPALLAQHPDFARNLLDYRYKHLPEAKALAKAKGFAGADFPWESAATGKETAPGGFSEGRHVTAGVGWAVWQYWLATGDKKWMNERGWPLLSSIADFWASRAKKGTSGKYDITKVTGPDEFKQGIDNNTYTNAMARNCLLYAGEAGQILGKPVNPKWEEVAKQLTLPFDKQKGYYLAREGDQGVRTKQADGELLLYPAALPMDRKTAEATFDFHRARPIKNGPAMTTSIHALVAARLGRAQEAETAFRESYRPFLRGPFLLFSEKRSMDRCVFTTGAGGVLQSVLYGFGGLDYSRPEGVLPGKPALPSSWKRLTITGIWKGGKRYTLTVTPEGRTLTPEK